MSLSDDFPWLEGVGGIFEPIATMGTGMLAEIPAGFYGLYETARTGDPMAGAQAVQDLQEQYTYMPRTEAGQTGLQRVGEGLEAVMDWPGLIPTMSANEAVAHFRDQAGRLGAAPAALLEGVLAAGPPIPARAGVLSLADRATDQANRVRKLYDVEQGSNLVAESFDDLHRSYWDPDNPADLDELEGRVFAAQKGRSPFDRMNAAATVASAKAAGADIPAKWMDDIYKSMMGEPRFASVMESAIDAPALSAARSQRNVDAMEEAFRDFEIDINPNQTFPERRRRQMDIEERDLRSGRLDTYSDQDYVDALEEAGNVPVADNGSLGRLSDDFGDEVYYHGTGGESAWFSGEPEMRRGTYLSPEPSDAEAFAEYNYEQPAIMPFQLRKGALYDHANPESQRLIQEFSDEVGIVTEPGKPVHYEYSDAFVDWLNQRGIDPAAIMVDEVTGPESVLMLRPEGNVRSLFER